MRHEIETQDGLERLTVIAPLAPSDARSAPDARLADPGPRDACDLARIGLLSTLPKAELDVVFAHLKLRAMQAGEDLGAGGELGENVFFAWTGSFRVTLMSPSGAYVTIRTIQAGSHFGEIAAFAEVPDRHFQVIADKNGLLLLLPTAVFKDLVVRCPALSRATLNSLARAAILRADRIYEFATLDMKLRLQAELLRLATQTGQRSGDRVIINPAPTQDALATQIGVTREGITRQMKHLVQQGLVQKRRGEIVVLDIERLRGAIARESGLSASHRTKLDLA